jgi:hypothetical protein
LENKAILIRDEYHLDYEVMFCRENWVQHDHYSILLLLSKKILKLERRPFDLLVNQTCLIRPTILKDCSNKDFDCLYYYNNGDISGCYLYNTI